MAVVDPRGRQTCINTQQALLRHYNNITALANIAATKSISLDTMMNKMKKGTAEGTMLLQQLMHSVFFHSFVKEIYVHRVSVCVCAFCFRLYHASDDENCDYGEERQKLDEGNPKPHFGEQVLTSQNEENA